MNYRSSVEVIFDERWIGPHGIGRFASELRRRLPNVKGLPLAISPLRPIGLLLTDYYLLTSKADVFFSPGFNSPVISSIPFVFTIHDLIHLKYPAENSMLKNLYYSKVVLPAAYRARTILTVSEYAKSEILEWTGIAEEKVVVVGNGVGPEYSLVGDRYEPGYPYFLYVGNRKPHKNFDRLLRAFALSGLPGETRLVCTGDPDNRVYKLIDELDLEKQVVFVGTVPDDVLPSYYRGAVALLFPSLYEGFGLPALEAMASGTPVVTSNVTALPEVVRDAAVLVDPYDTESIAWGIHQVTVNASLRSELRWKGLKRAKQFTWDKTAKLVLGVLQEAAQRGQL